MKLFLNKKDASEYFSQASTLLSELKPGSPVICTVSKVGNATVSVTMAKAGADGCVSLDFFLLEHI